MEIFRTLSVTLQSALLFSSATAFATTLVAVTTAKEAYLGADSRGQGISQPVCKVVEAHGVAVGMSGHLADATHFDAAKLITGALRRSTDLKSAIDNVIADVEDPLARSVAWAKVYAPSDYTAELSNTSGVALKLLFIGIVRGKPHIGFLVWKDQNGKIVHEAPTYLGPKESKVVGYTDAVKAYQDNHPDWVDLPATKIIETFLTVEAKQEPKFVGPPFSIVRIDTSGAHWICSGVCHGPHSSK